MVISISFVYILICGSGSNVCLSVCLKCNFVELMDYELFVVSLLLGMVLEMLNSVHRL